MRLAPETVRLRRAARAHAAGELSEQEYRTVRREVIDAFVPRAHDGDETCPRWRPEPTLRRVEHAEHAAADAGAEPAAARGSSRRWLWWLAAVLALGVGLAGAPRVASAGSAQNARIPPVSERDPDPVSSPRVAVTRVRVEFEAADLAAMRGVTVEQLQRLADAELAAALERNAPAAHGFTSRELDEVARLLQAFGVHEDTVPAGGLDAADARDLAALIQDQKRRRGVSVAELERVAGAVQDHLRAQGYFLAVAYVPSQHVHDGEASLAVLPGRLGDVRVDGGDPAPVARAFADLLGEPLLLADVSSRLLGLNALPGFTAQASFGPGEGVGEARLRLDVQEQRRWVADLQLDNHGDAATGERRVAARASWLNPRDAGDRLTAGVLASVDPANQTFGYLAYDTPLAGGYRLQARLGNNDFSWDAAGSLGGGEAAGQADALVLDVAARRALRQSRRLGLSLAVEGAYHQLDLARGTDQAVTLIGTRVAGHRVWDGPRIAFEGDLQAAVGRIAGDRFAGQRDDVWMIAADALAWMPVHLPVLAGEQKLALRLQGQFSDSLLPATRRFALGGAHRARSFDRDSYLADRGVVVGLDLRVPIPLGELVLFSDLGYGESLADDAGWARLADLGLGWEAELLPRLSSRLSWALPLTASGPAGFDDDGSRVYWSLHYEY